MRSKSGSTKVRLHRVKLEMLQIHSTLSNKGRTSIPLTPSLSNSLYLFSGPRPLIPVQRGNLVLVVSDFSLCVDL